MTSILRLFQLRSLNTHPTRPMLSRPLQRLSRVSQDFTQNLYPITRATPSHVSPVFQPIRSVGTNASSKKSKSKRAMVEATNHPLSGLWSPRPLQALHYGPNCVRDHLLSLLPSPDSKAFIITGSSLATKTPLVKQLEDLLTPSRHAGTFSQIKQHAPVADLDAATEKVQEDPTIDTLISLGGGSPIDSAKAISYRTHEKTGKYFHHIAIPTTLSVAECTTNAGYTTAEGIKTGIRGSGLAIAAILYDPAFAAHTPTRLWVGTGMRALDHALESLYNPTSSEVPCKAMCISAVSELFRYLPLAAKSHGQDASSEDAQDLTTRLFLAAYSSLGFLGQNTSGGLGLSHSLGYALGSPYNIPHGETSAMTLGHVVQYKARTSREAAEQIARCLPGIGGTPSGDAEKDAVEVGQKVLDLVKELGLYKSLTERGVGKDQLNIITERATSKKEGELYDSVKKLVEGLY